MGNSMTLLHYYAATALLYYFILLHSAISKRYFLEIVESVFTDCSSTYIIEDFDYTQRNYCRFYLKSN